MPMILMFWEAGNEHHQTEAILRRAGYDVVATDEPAYFTQVLSLIPVDGLVFEVSTSDMSSLRLLRAIRRENLCDVPAVILTEPDGADLRLIARSFNSIICPKDKQSAARLLACLESPMFNKAEMPVTEYWHVRRPGA